MDCGIISMNRSKYQRRNGGILNNFEYRETEFPDLRQKDTGGALPELRDDRSGGRSAEK